MADALSRMPQHNSEKMDTLYLLLPQYGAANIAATRSKAKRKLLKKPLSLPLSFTEAYAADPWLQSNSTVVEEEDGYFWCGGEIYVPEALRKQILVRCHDSKAAGHFGLAKTDELVRRQFWWPAM